MCVSHFIATDKHHGREEGERKRVRQRKEGGRKKEREKTRVGVEDQQFFSQRSDCSLDVG